MSNYCRYKAEFRAKTEVRVSQASQGGNNIVTVDIAVTFFGPKGLDRRPLPYPCVPSLPHLIGDITKVRLIWATNMRRAGDWIFTTQDKSEPTYLGWLPGNNTRTDFWRITFTIPPWGLWKTVHADYVLKNAYKKRISQDNCAYYADGSATLENIDFVFSGEGLHTAEAWAPTEGELPHQNYECNFMEVGDLFTWTAGGRIQNVLIAPPIDPIKPYELNYDYLGGFRNNLAEVSFMEPGVYAVRVLFSGGEVTRFFAVGSLAKASGQQTLPLSRTRSVGLPSGLGLFISKDQVLGELEGMERATDVEAIVAKIDAVKPRSVVFSTHGQPGKIELNGQDLFPFPGGYGYYGQCIGPYDLDRIIDGCEIDGCMVSGMKGVVDTVHLWCSLTGARLEELPCHILKYIAERLVERGGVQSAKTFAWNCPVFAVKKGKRAFTYCVPTGGEYVEYTSHSTYLPMGVPVRTSSVQEPNFYS